MTNTLPQNINAAALQARVNERAQRLHKDGYRAEWLADEVTVKITNAEGTSYEVSDFWLECTCPFYKENEFCKHVLGFKQLLADQAAEDAHYDALYAEHCFHEEAKHYC